MMKYIVVIFVHKELKQCKGVSFKVSTSSEKCISVTVPVFSILLNVRSRKAMHISAPGVSQVGMQITISLIPIIYLVGRDHLLYEWELHITEEESYSKDIILGMRV